MKTLLLLAAAGAGLLAQSAQVSGQVMDPAGQGVAGEDERAMVCYRELVTRVNAMGYYSYRLGVQSMAEIDRGDRYGELIRQIKQAVDPAGILSPGRYEPGARRAAGGGG